MFNSQMEQRRFITFPIPLVQRLIAHELIAILLRSYSPPPPGEVGRGPQRSVCFFLELLAPPFRERKGGKQPKEKYDQTKTTYTTKK